MCQLPATATRDIDRKRLNSLQDFQDYLSWQEKKYRLNLWITNSYTPLQNMFKKFEKM